MSLLLEALKKAELAKQAAKESPPATGAPPFTRDKLPDISQPMEIRSEDLRQAEPEPAPKPKPKPVLELALEEPQQRAAPAAEPAPASRTASFESAYAPPSEPERKHAQQLFEAKDLDVNPRKPFYIALGALGLFALGTIGYFWYQLQPRNLVTVPPASAKPATPLAAAPAVPPAEPAEPAASTVTPPSGTQPAAAPTTAAKPAAAPAAALAPPGAPAPARGPVFARQSRPAAEPGAAAEQQPGTDRRKSNIVITPAREQLDPVLESAFQAFNAGDLARARSDYQQVLQSRSDNRDALLGLAALEMRAARYDAAEGYYAHLLELDPRDALAQAGLIGLRGQNDPVAAESRLKTMIATQPDASFLYFTLGNQYAAQRRWVEAQQAYFKAYSGDPEHPDFAYNLAVSLDQLHQTKPALEYYQRALTLAQYRQVSFDKAQVSKRVAQLQR